MVIGLRVIALRDEQEFSVAKGEAPTAFFERATADTEDRIKNSFSSHGRIMEFVNSNS